MSHIKGIWFHDDHNLILKSNYTTNSISQAILSLSLFHLYDEAHNVNKTFWSFQSEEYSISVTHTHIFLLQVLCPKKCPKDSQHCRMLPFKNICLYCIWKKYNVLRTNWVFISLSTTVWFCDPLSHIKIMFLLSSFWMEKFPGKVCLCLLLC